MNELILVDNDVALKLCAYASAEDLIELASFKNRTLAMLPVARHTVDRRVQRARGIKDPGSLQSQWDIFSAKIDWIEPTTEEISFAAELEEQAITLSVELDGGESQLFAILVFRLSPWMLTGDKRAIVALETIGRAFPSERVACLEQVVFTLLRKLGTTALRTKICAEPNVDRALSIAFACHSKPRPVSDASIEAGLISYVDYIRKSAPLILIRGNDLSTKVP